MWTRAVTEAGRARGASVGLALTAGLGQAVSPVQNGGGGAGIRDAAPEGSRVCLCPWPEGCGVTSGLATSQLPHLQSEVMTVPTEGLRRRSTGATVHPACTLASGILLGPSL